MQSRRAGVRDRMRWAAAGLTLATLLAAGCATDSDSTISTLAAAEDPGITVTQPAATTRPAASQAPVADSGEGWTFVEDLDALAGFRADQAPPNATCSPGSTPDLPGDPTAPRPLTAATAAFDRESGLLVLISEGKTWTFDPCRNRWKDTGVNAPSDGIGMLVYHPDTDRIVAVLAAEAEDGDEVWAYDVDTNTWEPGGTFARFENLPLQVMYHQPSGLIVAPGRAYEPATHATIGLGGGDWDTPYSAVFTDPGDGNIYMYRYLPHRTFRYDGEAGWTRLEVATPALGEPASITYDEATGRTVLYAGGTLAAFDATVPEWEILYQAPPRAPLPPDSPSASDTIVVFDSANRRLLAVGSGGGVWAFDTPSKTWAALSGQTIDVLAAYQANPAPPDATCPPGSTPELPGEPTAPRPPLPNEDMLPWFVDGAAFDRESGLLVLVTGGKTWTFDPCTNRWTDMGVAAPSDETVRLIYHAAADLVVSFDPTAREVWVYDVDTNTWEPTGGHFTYFYQQALYDQATGMIVTLDGKAYDLDTGTTIQFSGWEWGEGDHHSALFSNPLDGRFYIHDDSPRTLRYDWGAGWTELEIEAPGFGLGCFANPPIVFDEATGRTVVFTQAGVLAAFDATVPKWEILYAPADEPAPPGNDAMMVLDSANRRLLFVGDDERGVWAYDTASREWIELLPAP